MQRRRSISYLLFLIALLIPSVPLQGQADAQQLVRGVAENEWRARQNPTPWMYVLRTEESGKKETLQVVHTADGPIYRVMSRNGLQLNANEQKAEELRLKKLLNNRDQQLKNKNDYWHDVRQGLEMLRILPDSSLFRDEGKSGQYVSLSFTPNPAFDPDTRTARLVHSLKGTMIVDPVQKRVLELKATIDQDVKFGGGLLGTIRKGGSFHFRQEEISAGEWVATLVDVDVTGRALLFHSLNKQVFWVFSDFRRIPPNLTVAQAVDMLESQPKTALTTKEH
jgi:hypothetical protein